MGGGGGRGGRWRGRVGCPHRRGRKGRLEELDDEGEFEKINNSSVKLSYNLKQLNEFFPTEDVQTPPPVLRSDHLYITDA